jgi:hypothetical protein
VRFAQCLQLSSSRLIASIHVARSASVRLTNVICAVRCLRRLESCVVFVVFPYEDEDDPDNNLTFEPFYFDPFNSRVNEELMNMSRFMMMHLFPICGITIMR